MSSQTQRKWFLLIHQIPPKPNALRVRIWRRLQQVGAVAVKPSVYVMPLTDASLEDLSWTLREIVDGGGDGCISEVRFVEGLTDEQVVSLFQKARQADYEKIIQDANLLLAEWSSGDMDIKELGAKLATPVARLKRQLESAVAIDFFGAPERGTAELLIQDLASRLAGNGPEAEAAGSLPAGLRGKTWVTRQNIFVDRIACGWLIRRFVDGEAAFKFVDPKTFAHAPGEMRFDMFEGEFTHEDDRCTFEVMVQRLGLKDRGLAAVAEIIHDIDLKENRYERAETGGLKALLTGLAASQADDHQRMQLGMQFMENLYAYFQGERGS